jgi:hypothetical protein
MSTAPNPAYKYQIGGSLERKAPSYVVRQADEEFYGALKAGEFCYVLNSRQMGKSSLRVQTMRQLQGDGIACGVIDITSIGSHDITPTEWYLGVVRRLAQSFRTRVKARQWWQEREGLSPVQRLGEFIEEVLLAEISQTIVIFIDEIDSVLKLDFKDDFFALIRSCYNQRAENPDYQRLTFALLGVATPSDLIQDKTRTPFNVGRAIALQGFQLPEVQPLAQGLEGKVDDPQRVLRQILAWTGGQPFLTQKLCQLVLSSPFTITAGSEAELIEGLVRSRLIENWESQDEPEHLKTIRDRLLRDQQRAGRRLGLYQQILQQGEITADDSYDQIELRLSGLVVEQQNTLRVYNRIYEAVFNQAWVNQVLTELRPYAELIAAWLKSNCEDESHLLRGQVLQNAQAWAAGKSLGNFDYQFLAASQELDKQEVLEAERQAKQLLAEAQRRAELALEEERQANQRLAEAQRKTKWQMGVGAIVLALSLVGAASAVVVTSNAKHQRQNAIVARDQANQERDAAIVQRQAAEKEIKVATEQEKRAQLSAEASNQSQRQAKAESEAAKHKAQKAKEDVEQKTEALEVEKGRVREEIAKAEKAKKEASEADEDRSKIQIILKQLHREKANLNEQIKQLYKEKTNLNEQVTTLIQYPEVSYICVNTSSSSPNIEKLLKKLQELGSLNILMKNLPCQMLQPGENSITIVVKAVRNRFEAQELLSKLKSNNIDAVIQSKLQFSFEETVTPCTTSCVGLQRGDSGPLVMRLAKRLREEGYDPGAIDGLFGRQLERAIQLFQRANSLSVDGVAGIETLVALGIQDSPPKNSYVVVVPVHDDNTLREVRRYVPGAVFNSSSQGSYVNAGEFPDRDSAELLVSVLRSQGLDAKVVYFDK